ncbi:hypothetical protein J2Z69_000151 [Paenibacillus shirakamiensis]|uniref:Anti-sigma-W factor RsiW n=1 Tax=Paenibacillus shirakamiensis TaxID=1265935 RepID=A0ABS4JBP7_9BACL|nr:zf-HC2 domain-containing protein [Paenibacillus shirakamiensis]MBP1999132.1 hypothetical protein [Paenibacillus shirakamiensis]
MKCPEAAACMHRYLDGELSNAEESEFLQHINDCSDCYEEFDLLKRLSNDLYQLPEVTPRFNLVDSILPRLEAIEQTRDLAIQGELTLESSRDKEMTSVAQRSQKRVVARWQRFGAMGGAVAAAIMIIGFFMLQHEPKQFPSADKPTTASYDTNALEKKGSAYDLAANPSSPQSAPPAKVDESSGGSSTATSILEDSLFVAKEEKSIPEGKSRSSSSEQKVEEPKTYASSSPTTKSKVPATENKGTTGYTRNSDNTRNTDNKSTAPVTTPKKDINPDASDSLTTMGVTGTGVTADTAPEMLRPETSITTPLNPDSLQSITSQKSLANEWTSTDGLYTVILDKNQVKLFRNGPQDPTLISEQVLDGSWVQGTWSDDSKTFIYKTSSQDKINEHSIKADEIEVK